MTFDLDQLFAVLACDGLIFLHFVLPSSSISLVHKLSSIQLDIHFMALLAVIRATLWVRGIHNMSRCWERMATATCVSHERVSCIQHGGRIEHLTGDRSSSTEVKISNSNQNGGGGNWKLFLALLIDRMIRNTKNRLRCPLLHFDHSLRCSFMRKTQANSVLWLNWMCLPLMQRFYDDRFPFFASSIFHFAILRAVKHARELSVSSNDIWRGFRNV